MFYLIGTGIGEDGISLKGFDTIKECDSIYIERYTNKWEGLESLEKRAGIKIKELERSDVEENQNKLLEESREKKVSLLIPGDPLAATTHIDLMLECKKRGIDFEVIGSSSIFTAIAETGLQLYKFGKTTTIPYTEEGYAPTSFLDAIKENKERGLHTLCLLDVKPPRYMTVKEALQFINEEKIIGAHFGKETVIRYGRRDDLIKEDIPTPSVVIVPGKLHDMEKEVLELYKI